MKFSTKEILSMFLAFVGIALIFWMFQPEPKTPEQLTAEAELIRAEAEADAVRIAAEEEARQKEEAERQRKFATQDKIRRLRATFRKDIDA